MTGQATTRPIILDDGDGFDLTSTQLFRRVEHQQFLTAFCSALKKGICTSTNEIVACPLMAMKFSA